MQCKKLFEIIDSLSNKYLDILEDVCKIESPTNYKEGVDAVGNYFIKMATEKGWNIETLELKNAGNAICITLNHGTNSKSISFSGHIDTVHPLGVFGNPTVRRDNKNMYGPGTLDCKGGVVASFLAMDALERCGFKGRPVQLIIQTDEETGSQNSDLQTVKFMCEKAKNSIAFLNTEGIQGNTAVLIRKGILRFRFDVYGRAIHSARCTEGANAVAEAAHKILKMEKMKDPTALTCNCGVINGGTAPNSVAENCTFFADIRFSDANQCDEARKIAKEIAETNEIKGCSCILTEESYRPAMPLSPKNIQLLETVNKIFEANGLSVLTSRACLSGSDAAYVTEADIPCIDNIGVAGGNIHSVREYITLSSMAEAAKRLASVAYCI